jgi:hypothetical protein
MPTNIAEPETLRLGAATEASIIAHHPSKSSVVKSAPWKLSNKKILPALYMDFVEAVTLILALVAIPAAA